MSTESPFREQDLLARLEALTAERDELSRARALATAREACARRSGWSWWRFLLGVAVLPAAMVLLGVVISVIR